MSSIIITDSAANMIKAFSLPGFERLGNEECEDNDHSDGDEDDGLQPIENEDVYNELVEISTHICCFAHTIKMVIKDGFKQAGIINKVLSKVSTIVSHVHKPIYASEILESEKPLQNATVTHWNSELNMVQSILRVLE